MVYTREYRICLPMTVEEYRIGQLYMIARHSFEKSSDGEGVEVVTNKEINDEEHGSGQYTEKRIHLSSHLPYWVQALIPKIFYVTEKSWNYYPYTITEYTCSFIPKFSISIQTRFEDNNGSSYNCLQLSEEELERREVYNMDILNDDMKPHHYKKEEDPKFCRSEKTGRGPLESGWTDTSKPVMCCYKAVHIRFEVWGLQTKVEEYLQGAIRDILLMGHRQAFAWMDEWYDMKIEDVRSYEKDMHNRTNLKLKSQIECAEKAAEEKKKAEENGEAPKSPDLLKKFEKPATSPGLSTPTSPSPKSWFSWS